MKKLTNEDIKRELLIKFPEFQESDDFKLSLDPEGGPYEYLARFADYLLKEMDKSSNAEIVKRAFGFINDIYSRENISAEVWDLMGIELLETIETDEKHRDLANKYLTGKALKAFQNQEGRPNE